ncbi:MAG: hypothetical protein IPF66_09535 [Holophagales bacterium]|nr:hypothetical protein [Holophagales bacterium]
MTPRTAIRLTRPFTLLPPLLGIVSGAVCAFGSIHNPDPGTGSPGPSWVPSRSAPSARRS